MRVVLVLLAVIGIAASSLALREHYRTDTSPCSINERWDCGIVNHSPYAMLWGVPVATIGIAGYLLLGALALKRWYGILLPVALAGLAFSLYLAHIEAHLLGVWCIYCVASLGVISVFSLLALGRVSARLPSADNDLVRRQCAITRGQQQFVDGVVGLAEVGDVVASHGDFDSARGWDLERAEQQVAQPAVGLSHVL